MPIKRLPSEITNEGSLSPAPNVVSKPTFILMKSLALAEVTAGWIRGTIISRYWLLGALRKVRSRGVREWW